MTKNQQISFLILKAHASGMDIKAAIDHVCGAGTSAKLISDLYNELRAGK